VVLRDAHLQLSGQGSTHALHERLNKAKKTVINPLLVDEQIRGGVVQGLGAAFFEECVYGDGGQLTNGSLADYLVPMAVEMPDIVVAHVETPTLDTQLGAKGVGEAGTAAASAASSTKARPLSAIT
jgi:xanthine dehydrogenase molybdopterin-binding subunit B